MNAVNEGLKILKSFCMITNELEPCRNGAAATKQRGFSFSANSASSALLFKKLATAYAPLFKKVETLRWRGATTAFAAWAEKMKALRLVERCENAAARISRQDYCGKG